MSCELSALSSPHSSEFRNCHNLTLWWEYCIILSNRGPGHIFYTCQLFLSQMHEIFVVSWLGFLKTLQLHCSFKNFWPFLKDRTLPKKSEDNPNNFEPFWSYLKGDIFKLWCDTFRTQSQNTIGEMNWIFIININHVLKNNSSGFLSQVWEIVLDAWDRCL